MMDNIIDHHTLQVHKFAYLPACPFLPINQSEQTERNFKQTLGFDTIPPVKNSWLAP